MDLKNFDSSQTLRYRPVIRMKLDLLVYIAEIIYLIKKDGPYVINLDDYSDTGTHWIALYVNNKTVTYFDSLRIEHIHKEVKKFIGNRNIITNIYRIQNYDSIMCEYFCIGFIDYMVMGKSLTYYTNPFSPNNCKKNDDIILNYFLNKLKNG